MDTKTLEALKASIAKWEKNAKAPAADDVSIGARSCPLCLVYHPRSGGKGSCLGCPVRDATGSGFCENSPYVRATWALCDWHRAVKGGLRKAKTAFREYARSEVSFLKSLLPTEAE